MFLVIGLPIILFVLAIISCIICCCCCCRQSQSQTQSQGQSSTTNVVINNETSQSTQTQNNQPQVVPPQVYPQQGYYPQQYPLPQQQWYPTSQLQGYNPQQPPIPQQGYPFPPQQAYAQNKDYLQPPQGHCSLKKKKRIIKKVRKGLRSVGPDGRPRLDAQGKEIIDWRIVEKEVWVDDDGEQAQIHPAASLPQQQPVDDDEVEVEFDDAV